MKLGLADAPKGTAALKMQFYLPTGDSTKGWHQPRHLRTVPARTTGCLRHRDDRVHGRRLAADRRLGPVPVTDEGKFAGDVFFYGIGPSFTVYDRNGTQFAPVVELVGWSVLNGLRTGGDGDASANIVNLKIGGRLTYRAGSIYVGYGHALTEETWYDDVLRFEYRYSF